MYKLRVCLRHSFFFSLKSARFAEISDKEVRARSQHCLLSGVRTVLQAGPGWLTRPHREGMSPSLLEELSYFLVAVCGP